MSADHRRAERKAMAVQFSARDATGAGTLLFSSADLSEGGAFLRSDLLLEQGEALSLEFEVPGEAAVQAGARVAWVRRFPEEGQPAGMGVQFLEMSDEDRARLVRALGG